MGEAEKPTLVMCPHCKYAYPAGLERCNVCGYPWPWLEKKPERRT